MKTFAIIFMALIASGSLKAQNKTDWLLDNRTYKAAVRTAGGGKQIIMENGLLRRIFNTLPDLACTGFEQLATGEQLLRAVKPEAYIEINGQRYALGGLNGQKQQAYLLESQITGLTDANNIFRFCGYETRPYQAPLKWNSRRWPVTQPAATGTELVLHFRSAQPVIKNIEAEVHYAVFDGIPLLAKWVNIKNNRKNSIRIDQVVNETLAMPEEESAVVGKTTQMKIPHSLYVESNYAFNNAMKASLSDQTTHWKADSTYTSQVNYDRQTPCLLEVYPEKGIHSLLKGGETFRSVCTYELLLDSYDRERNGLAQRRFYRTVAPWTTANPVFMHLISTEESKVKAAIDQCAETGYEAVILSFGSGLNMEDTSAVNIRRFKALADYAHKKGIGLGGYSLFSSRRIDDQTDVIDPKTGKPGGAFFGGHAPCLGSKWGLGYLEKIKKFIGKTGFDLFENDGPYPGDVCASAKHPGHTGLADSQWKQMELQKGLYHWMNRNGVYVNAPDWYFLDGTNKIALGYREVNFSLPREEQVILNRQNIYDGTWEKTGPMSWGFVPLTEYQGGGAAATIEPLHDHLGTYTQLMMQYYGAGVQACYRGPRLYDTDQTKRQVRQVLVWYKKHRPILNADIIHLRRPDGRDWDGIMHADPQLDEKALVMLYNPLPEKITRKISLPLYYTGLNTKARITFAGKTPETYVLNRDYTTDVQVEIPAAGYTWLLVTAPE